MLYTYFKDREMRAAEALRGNNAVLPLHATSVRVDAEDNTEADALLAADELIRESEMDERERSLREAAERELKQPSQPPSGTPKMG